MADEILAGGNAVQTGENAFSIDGSQSGELSLPENLSVTDAEFTFEGGDLVMTFPDGTVVTVEGYQDNPNPPTLVSSDGAEVGSDVISAMADAGAPADTGAGAGSFGFIQPEQAEVIQAAEQASGNIANNPNVISGTDGEPIGNVESLQGEVFAIRVDGTRVRLELGDQVFQGDILESSAEGNVGILLADETTFAMGPEGRMVLDEMVYDPATQQGSVSMSVLQGVFTFVSGQVAKTDPDAMTLDTPVATIGIRGTQVGLDIRDGENLNVHLMEERFGFVGEVVVVNDGGVQVLNDANAFTSVNSFDSAPSPFEIVGIQDILTSYQEETLRFLPTRNSEGERTSANTYDETQEVEGENRESMDFLNDFQTDAGGPQEQAPDGTIRVTGKLEKLNIIEQARAELNDDNPFLEDDDDDNIDDDDDNGTDDDDDDDDVITIDDDTIVLPGDIQDLVDAGTLQNVTVSQDGRTVTANVAGDFDGTGMNYTFVLTGDNEINTITGGSGDDTLAGTDGDDVLNGGDGDDTLIAAPGGGDDTYDGGDGIDTITFAASDDNLIINLTNGTATDDAGGNGIGSDTIINIENVVGGSGNDTIIGDENVNFLEGGLGDDFIDGRGGQDTAVFSGTYGQSTIRIVDGVLTVTGPDGTDTIENVENFAFTESPNIVVGLEDTAISLDIGDHVSAADAAVSIVVAGVPAGAQLSAGTLLADGTWLLNSADLEGLTVTGAANSAEDFSLNITTYSEDYLAAVDQAASDYLATQIDPETNQPLQTFEEFISNGGSALDLANGAAQSFMNGSSGSGSVNIAVIGVIDPFSITMGGVELTADGSSSPITFAGTEDQEVSLDIVGSLSDTDGSEVISVTISGLPTLEVVEATREVPLFDDDGEPLLDDEGVQLTETETYFEPATDANGNTVGAHLIYTDANGNDVVLPSNDTGTYNLTGEQLNNLRLVGSPDDSADFSIEISAQVQDGESTATVFGSATVELAAAADVPTVNGSAETTLEDQPVSISFDIDKNDISEHITDVTLTGIPQGSKLSIAYTDPDTGETFPVQIPVVNGEASIPIGYLGEDMSTDGLVLTPPAHLSGSFDLQLEVTSTEPTNGDTATNFFDMPLTITAVADELGVTINDTTVVDGDVVNINATEDGTFGLNIDALTADTDGSEVISVTISGVPDGAVMSAGTENSDGSWTLTPEEFSTLSITPPLNSDENFDLTVTVVNVDNNEDTLTLEATVSVDVEAIADAANLAATDALGMEDTPIALDISSSLNDTDGSEELSITISGVPAGAVLSAGTDNGDGSWTLDANQLDGLTITPGLHVSGEFNLTVTATTTEAANGDQAVVSQQIGLSITPDPDAPIVNVTSITGNEDTDIPLNIDASLVDQDGSETLSISISGVPEGAVLSAGTNLGNGVWDIDPADLANLKITPPADSNVDFTLQVTATATESNGEFVETTADIPVNLLGVADTPNLGTPETVGLEDTLIPLNIVTSLNDTDGSETLSITIENVPDLAIVFVGGERADMVDGVITLSPDQLGDVKILPPANSDEDFDLLITATTTENDADESGNGQGVSSISGTLSVVVQEYADPPALMLFDTSGNEDTTVPLNIAAILTDQEETLSVNVSGIPDGVVLSSGTKNDDGSWTLEAGDLNGLTMELPENFSGEFPVSVVATSTTDDGTFAETTGSFNVSIAGVADDPNLNLTDVVADEGTAIPLNIDASLVDTDGSETLSITVSNIPEGSVLTNSLGDVLNIVDGAVELSSEQLEGLTMTTPPGLDTDFTLQVTAMTTENDADVTANGQGVASVSGVINVDMQAVAEVPTLVLQDASGNEDQPISLDISAIVADQSETLSITISGVPEGAMLSAGSNNNDGTWTLNATQLENLTITPPADSNENFQLEITATSTEQDGTFASSTGSISVGVTGVADAPTLNTGDITGLEDAAIPLNVTSNLTDTDGSETLSVSISGVPAGAVLSAGSKNADGTWTLTGEDLTGLTMTPPKDVSGNFSLTVTATSTENDGDSTSVTGLMNVNVGAVADVPTLILHDAAGFEDDAIPLEISTAAAGGDEIVSVTISGIPTGAVLSAGIDNEDGTWTLSEDQLEGLTITPPNSSGVNFQIGVTVTSMDGDDLAETTQALNVSVTSVADKPTLNVPSQVNAEGQDAVDLDIQSALNDLDGSESLSINISNIPNGAVLNIGNTVLNVVGGSVDLEPSQLSGLQITAPPGFDGNFTLQVTATATDTDPDNDIPTGLETSISIGYIDVEVEGVVINDPDAPELGLEDTQGYEDNPIPLDIDANLTDPSETLSLTITGVPAGATLSAGTDLGNGTWSLLPEEANGLTITPPDDSNVDFALTVTATSTTEEGEFATTTGTINVDVIGVADTPNLAGSVGEGTVVSEGIRDIPSFDHALSNVVMYLDDGNGNIEKVRVEDFPDGNGEIHDVNDIDLQGFINDNYPGSELVALTVKAGNNHSPIVGPGEGELFLIDPGVAANTLPLLDHVDQELSFDNSFADYLGSSSGESVTIFPLDIAASLNDLDGSETLSITISDLPEGVTLSAGEQADDGTWVLTEEQLDGLTMSVPLGVDPDFDFDVTATATENDGDTASVTTTIGIDGDGEAEAPELDVSAAAGDEDTAIELDISAALTDTDGSETLSINISGVPAGASLSAGTDNGNGTWSLTPEQLTGLTVTPPADSDVDFTLSVEATSVEHSTGDTAVTTGTIPVTVNAVADAPSVAAGDGDGDVGQTVPLDIQSVLADTDGSESLSITIAGFPEGASLNAGTDNLDGSYTLSVADLDGLAISLPDGASDDFDLTVTATSTEFANNDQASNVVTAAINVDPLANDDRNVVEIGDVTSGNVLTGEGDSTNSTDAADVGSESGNSVVDVSFGGVTRSFSNPNDVQNDGDGNYIEIAGDHGTLKMYDDGSYDYAADESEAVSHIAGLTGTASSGAVEEAWSGVQTFAFDFGTSFMNESGQFDPSLADAEVSFTSAGIGVEGTQNGMPAPDQINHDNDTGQSEALGINLGGETSSATLTVSNLFNNEDGGEQGNWQAFDADGNLVGEGVLNASTVDYSGSSNVGTAEISLPDGAPFQYLVFTSSDTGNDNNQNDSSDFFIRALQYETNAEVVGEDVFTYTMQDADGDTASATLSIDVSQEQDTTASDPTLNVTDAAGFEDNAIPLDIAAGLGDLDGSESLSISISGVPAGAVLSAGTYDEDSDSWSIAPEDIAGLTITPPSDSNEDFPLTVTATSTEANGGDTATTTATINVGVTGIADMPTLSLTIGEPELTTTGGEPVETTINVDNVTDGNLGFSVTGRSINQDGSLTDASTDNISFNANPVGFGVSGAASGDQAEVGFDNQEGVSEELIVSFDSPASSADVSFAWMHPGEQASYDLYLDGVKVGEGVITGITDQIDPPVTFTAEGGSPFDQIVFKAPDSGDDYLINSISFETPAAGETLAEYPLDISSSLTDTDGSETLSITVGGLPEGAELSAGTQNNDGTWTLTPAQLTGLTMTVEAGNDNFEIQVTATSTENDGDTASVTVTADVGVPSGDQTASDPNLTAGDVGGNEDTAIALDIASSLSDTDGSETLSITISGMPDGAELSAGTNNNDGTWTLAPGDLDGLTVTPPANSNEDFSLTVTATSTESASGDTATQTTSFNVDVTGVADTPGASAQNETGVEDQWIQLHLDSAISEDTDGSETLSITISGVPEGARLNPGTEVGNGVWTATAAELPSVCILPPDDFSGEMAMTLSVTSTEDDGDTATTEVPFTVNVTGDADAPTVSIGNAAGYEDQPIALDVSAALSDTDGSETLSVTIGGVPAGAQLSAGINNNDGTWTLTGPELEGLSITPPADSNEDMSLTITATATEENGDTATTTGTMNVAVTGVADAPTLSATIGEGVETSTTSDITITNMGQVSAGYNNSYGYYVKDEDGNPGEGMVIWTNAKEDVGDTFTIEGVDPDSIGFFIIPDGGSQNGNLDAQTPVTFTQDQNGNWQAVDGNGHALSAAGGSVLFNDPSLNNGDFDYTTDNSVAGNQNWEDLNGGGDNDFNDVNINVETTTASGSGQVEYPLNITSSLTDTDGSETLSITVSGLPEGAELSAGTQNNDGSWSLSAGQLAGLVMTVAAGSENFELSITATSTENDGDVATVGLTLDVDDVPGGDNAADGVNLSASNASGNEDNAIALDIASSLNDTDGSETLSISIAGVPDGATLSAGIKNNDGTWTLEQSDLANLTVMPADDSDDNMSLTITATSTEISTGDTSSQTATLNVAVNAVADAPTLTATLGQGTVNQGDPVEGETSTVFSSNFGSSDVGFVQTLDGWSTNSDAIESWDSSSGHSGDGGYVELNDDSVDYFDDATSINRDFPTEDGATYTLTFRYSPRPGYDEDVNRMDVRVDGQSIDTVSADGSGNSDNVWQTQTITFVGNGETMNLEFLSTGEAQTHGRGMRLDDVVLTETTAEEPGETTVEYPLDISAALTDTDGSEELSISISDLPEGAQLSAGTQNNDGSWTLNAGQLTGLTLTVAAGTEDFNLSVTAVSAESSNNDSASTSVSLFVDVPEVNTDNAADGVNLSAGDVSGNEDAAIALDIASSLNDTDGSESLSITISGVPNGASLSAGTKNNDGTWSLESADLDGLTITPSDDSDEDMTLTVSATSTESASGDTSTQTVTMNVGVNAVADAPTLSAVVGDPVVGGGAETVNIPQSIIDAAGAEDDRSVTVSGVGEGVMLSAGTDNGNGTWTLTAAQLEGLSVSTEDGSAADLSLGFSVIDAGGGSETLVSANFSSGAQGFVYNDGVFSADNAPSYNQYYESGTASNGNLSVTLGGVDSHDKTDLSGGHSINFDVDDAGSGTLTFNFRMERGANFESDEDGMVVVSIDGVEYEVATHQGDGDGGSSYDSGWQTVTIDVGDLGSGTHTLTLGAQLEKKTASDEVMKVSFDNVSLSVTSENSEVASATVDVDVDAQNVTFDLDIDAALTDTDGSETLSVTVSDLPEGATLSAGTQNNDGTWTLSPAQLTGLTMTVAAGAGDFNLSVAAVSTEQNGGDTATSTTTVAVDVPTVITDQAADGVNLTAGDVSGDEDTAIALDIASSLNDTDGSESLSITISGVPNGAVLSAGTNNNNGTWTLNSGDLSGLTITPPADSNEDFTLSVTAVGTESEGGAAATQTASFDVDVTGVADGASVSASATLVEGHLGGGSQSGSGNGSQSGSGHGSHHGSGSGSGQGYDSDLIAFFEVTEDDDGNEIDNQVGRNDGDNHHVGINNNSDGPSGTSAVFDGNNDYIEVDHKSNMESESGTFVLWFNTENADSKQGLFSKDSNGYDDGGHLTAFVDDGQLQVRMQSTNSSYMVQGGQVNSGAWHQMAFTYGPDGMRLYVDGNLVDSDSYSGGMQGNEEPLIFGANQWTSGNGVANNLQDFFTGEMDKMAVYDRALTPTEIANMHDAGVSQVVTEEGETLVYDLDIEGTLVDVDGSESLSFEVRGLPNGVTLSAGQSDGNGTWSLSTADLEGLTMTVDPSVSEDFSIEVVAIDTENDGDSAESPVVSLDIDVTIEEPVEINGTWQSETLEGAGGNDLISGNDGHDKLYGFSGDDILNGGSGNDSLFGDAGDDVMDGGTGHDYLSGGAGNDTLTAGDGDDTLDGGSGNDDMFGGTGHDVMLGGEGNDDLEGGHGDDRLYGGDGDDALDGGTGHDRLYGGDGNDVLSGGDGNDTLQGGLGDDILTGGSGQDRFEFDAQSGHDIIQDIMEQDTVVFEGQEFHADDMIFNENEDGDVVVSFAGVEGQSVTLNGVSMDDLDRNGDGDPSDGYSVTESNGSVSLTIDQQ
ncbi:MAG: LamG-like jellyroll fold domain-containing protein [Rhodospirillales bacterium]